VIFADDVARAHPPGGRLGWLGGCLGRRSQAPGGPSERNESSLNDTSSQRSERSGRVVQVFDPRGNCCVCSNALIDLGCAGLPGVRGCHSTVAPSYHSSSSERPHSRPGVAALSRSAAVRSHILGSLPGRPPSAVYC
jgi:hypothetical protein